MDYGKAFTYVFEDKDWVKKILIGAVIAIVPIVNFALLGWTVEVMRRVQQGQADIMPDWSEFGELFKKGFMAFVVALVYFLPVILIQLCSAATNFGITTAAAGSDSSTVNTLTTVASVTGICFSCLALILSIAGGLLV